MSLHHNQVRNITASLLKEFCHDACIEPRLQKLTGESLNERVANTTDEARLDISARGFWTTGQLAFFDVRVFNPIAKRYVDQELSRTYVMNEKEKKKMYNERVMQIEHGSFTPLVMSATLLRLIEEWKEKLDMNYFVGAILMDLSKAFDCVTHDLIIAKLYAYGFDLKSLEYILSYLTTGPATWFSKWGGQNFLNYVGHHGWPTKKILRSEWP